MFSVAFVSSHGGVGKSTAALGLAQTLAMMNFNVLVVDLDPEAALTRLLQKEPLDDLNFNRMDRNQDYFTKIIHKFNHKLSYVPGNPACMEFLPEFLGSESRKTALRRSLIPVQDRFDFVVMDSPPDLNIITENAIQAADLTIIPVQGEYFTVKSVDSLLKSIRERLEIKHNIRYRLLFTAFDTDCALSNKVRSELHHHHHEHLLTTVIPRDGSLYERNSSEQFNINRDIFSRISFAFTHLAKEITDYEKIQAGQGS